MSYCFHPDCPDPGHQKTTHPDKAKFCSNCGAKLLLSDRFRILKPISHGRYSRTFLALDEHKPLKPFCIVKQFCPAGMAAKQAQHAIERFQLEAIRLDDLGHHPQIPALLAQIEQDQQQYLVQEFIDGQTLEQDLRQAGALNEDQIRQVLQDLLSVLEYVHERQVIHRDIKPQNILRRVEPTVGGDRPLVLVDFDAAKFAAGEEPVGGKIGIHDYIAPEQLAGQTVAASDLYSLGVTCIHLLTQQSPAHLLDPTSRRWIWHQQAVHPVSESLRHILDRMLQPQLGDRYRSAAEVLQDLRPPIDPAQPAPAPTAESSPQASGPAWACTHTLVGHESWVRSVAFGPNGDLLASGSGDKTVRLWSATTGELLHTLTGHSTWVRSVAFSPNGDLLASASNDKTIRLWTPQTGQLQNILTAHTDWVRALAFNPTGQILASGGQDKAIYLWHPANPEPLQTLLGHDHWVLSLAISASGTVLASGSHDHSIRLWQLPQGQPIRQLNGHTAEVLAVAISPDSQVLASASADHTIRLWQLDSGQPIAILAGHTNSVNAIAFSPDGQHLASTSSDRTIKLWDIQSHTLAATLAGHMGWVWSVAFSPDGQTLCSGSWDGTLKLWQQV